MDIKDNSEILKDEKSVTAEFEIEAKDSQQDSEEDKFLIKSTADIQQIISQYTTPGPFVEVCKCDIYEKLLKGGDELVIKEATTGYFDPKTGQETGNFVTYVIEFGV